MSDRQNGFIEELRIVALIHGGRGLGRHQGKAVFVVGALPGDLVSCRIVKDRPRYAEAELVELLVASPQRREPPCPYFGDCGGCQWQQLSYPDQCEWKSRIFADQLLRPKLCAVDRLLPIVPATDEWRYRSRVQLKCHLAGDRLLIGFYRQGSHFVVDIDDCLLLAEPIRRTLGLLRHELQTAPCRDSIPQLDLACGDDGAVRLLVQLLPRALDRLRPWFQVFARRHDLSVCLQAGRKATIEVLHGISELAVDIDQPPLRLHYGPGGFAQVNTAQNRVMVGAVLTRLELTGDERVLDLFCGMGNFSLPLARRGAAVVGVEGYAPSIFSARANAQRLGLAGKVAFHAADAAAFLAQQAAGAFDIVVLDPPRSGCGAMLVDNLWRIKPERILSISCEPSTLARDLRPLLHNGYHVVSSQAFDLFPQTWHIESVTELRRDLARHA
jgi:23S rRNA (uracil1939-C5)-methyltransferase